MKLSFKVKVAIMTLLSIVLFQATMTLSFAQTSPPTSAREQSTSLENLYRENVRKILDNLVAPDDYTLIISATIKNNEKKLKEFGNTIERTFLQDLPTNDPTARADASNLRLGFKQKVDIQIVLAENVSADRDTIFKDIIRHKLNLSEESGDSISVVRATRIAPFPNASEQPRSFDLTTKRIALLALITMMMLTSALLWIQRRKEKKKQHEHTEVFLTIEQKRAHEDAEAVATFESTHPCQHFKASYVLEPTSEGKDDSLGFIFNTNEDQRPDLLDQEASGRVAHSCEFKNNQPPATEVENEALGPRESIERTKDHLSVLAEGPMLAAELLRSLPAGREEEIVKYLFDQHPAEAEKLRRVRVMFQDLPYYPAELTRKAIQDLEPNLIQQALTGYDPLFTGEFLQLLPTNKRKMILKNLLERESDVPQSQSAERRREISTILEQHFESQKFRVADYWTDQEFSNKNVD